MSGGRVELGLGAGWFDAEHTATASRSRRRRSGSAASRSSSRSSPGLWTAEKTFSFDGSYYRLADSPALPKPAQRPNPPIIIGGAGAKRTPRLARGLRRRVQRAVPLRSTTPARPSAGSGRRSEETGRDRHVLSAAQTVCVGRDQAELERRAAAIGTDLAELRENGLAGTPAEVVEKIGRIAELGAERVYLQVLDLARPRPPGADRRRGAAARLTLPRRAGWTGTHVGGPVLSWSWRHDLAAVLLTISTTGRGPPPTSASCCTSTPTGCRRSPVLRHGARLLPEAGDERCTAALLLEVDPVALVRRGGKGRARLQRSASTSTTGPYAASSLLAVALGDVFRTALAGRCDARPELAGTAAPAGDRGCPALPCRGGAELARPAVRAARLDGRGASRCRWTTASPSGATRATSA